jgi:glutamyl-tRNA(Gln) amidotransferase subunit E
MCGLEVHQQLLTATKMFCHCPAGLYTDEVDGTMLRHMRPTLSELGEYDGTALMEFKTKKNIIYLLHKSNVCTYEMDDTPPFLVNQQALDVAIEQCLMLGCDIIDEVHIARKQYLDGSIPTGFQRTAIVGVGGKLPFLGRELGIIQVSMEEDSCREVSDEGHLIVWRTDRLGMPLIETVTTPDIHTPQEAAQAILLIGRVCRSTGHVRTGMGASRQDVNVSVRGGRRVEIKGVPKAGWAPALVHGEAVRQVNLLKLREELHRRGFTSRERITVEHHDVTRLFAKSQLGYVREEEWDRHNEREERKRGTQLGEGQFCVRAVKLSGLAGTMNWPTQPERTFTKELAGRIRVIAGLDQPPLLLNSERWPDYDGSDRELHKLKQVLRCGDDDSLVVVWGPLQDTLTAADEIRIRFEDAVDGVPNETRQPFADGSTSFERILPGPDRMYPDTDSPPTRVTRERVERLRAGLPETPWQREARYAAAGVPPETMYYLIRRGGAQLVDLVSKHDTSLTRRACFFFGEQLKGLRRKGVPVDTIPAERWQEMFLSFAEQPRLWQAWRSVVEHLAQAPFAHIDCVLRDLKLDQPAKHWSGVLDAALVEHFTAYPGDSAARKVRWYMGRTMNKLRGVVPVQEVAAEVSRAVGLPGDS